MGQGEKREKDGAGEECKKAESCEDSHQAHVAGKLGADFVEGNLFFKVVSQLLANQAQLLLLQLQVCQDFLSIGSEGA
eukprot:356191-Chlamydomonas_euryale.AAC.8